MKEHGVDKGYDMAAQCDKLKMVSDSCKNEGTSASETDCEER